MDEKKRPVKSEKLKIIDHLGTYYATFDGSEVWEIEKWLFKLLMMCNGKKTFEQIAKEITQLSEHSLDDIKIGLRPIFEELEQKNFVEFV